MSMAQPAGLVIRMAFGPWGSQIVHRIHGPGGGVEEKITGPVGVVASILGR